MNRQQNEAKVIETRGTTDENDSSNKAKASDGAAAAVGKKKNKKKRKNKGLKAFMDGDAEMAEYNNAN